MTKFLLQNNVSRPISFTLLILFITEIIYPTTALALTSGPSQPEVQSFEPISTSDMVDIFSGDFKYNIPLMDVEGYPLNIAYGSAISTDQEASWVGLGWNLNVGNINRAMRGIPDDFKGDLIKKEMNIKPNRTYGINAGVDFELFGKESNKSPGSKKGKKFKLKPSVGVGVNFNNYTGFGVDLSIGIGISAGVAGKGKLDAGLGLHSNASTGLDISPNLSFQAKTENADAKDNSLVNVNSASGSFSGSFNTRAGLKHLSFNSAYSKSVEKTTNNTNFDPSAGFPNQTAMINSPQPNETGGLNVRGETRSAISLKGRNASGTVNFGLQSYVPNINMNMNNNSVGLSVKFTTQLFGTDADIRLAGYYSSQSLAEKNKDVPAFGYMYSEYGKDNSNSMMDFNREKDGSFSRTTKNLPITNFTYDVYNATAQGMGGTFRPFRSDVGHVFDASSASGSDSYNLGVELGGGNLFKIGIDVNVIDVNSTSGKWTDDNEALDYFKFNSVADGSSFEPYYFKQVGEMSVNESNLDLYSKLQEDEAYGVRIQQGYSNSAGANSNLPNIKSKKNLEKYNYDNTSNAPLNNGQNKLTDRQKRNQSFNILTKAEAINFGLQKKLYDGTGVKNVDAATGSEMKVMNTAPGHHIAEINVINTDGSRYYYGLPAYNLKTKEYSFNISNNSGQNGTDAKGLIAYDAQAASSSNERGIDNHYNMTETPAYAYSYLLTAIVSADYVDVNGNGPDDEDLGNYTKFHYVKSFSGSEYQWRMPIDGSPNKANFSENSKSNTLDNSANYTYGQKELWYLDEIETKNYIAKFSLSNRKDGFGVSDEQGNISFSSTPSKKLDKIELFVKREYLANPTTAVPVKTANFLYTYDLCTMSPRLPNNSGSGATGNELSNNGGKLTLKQVYFTYGKSSRARFNKFQFSYANNPNYHCKAYDRWGNYKPVSGTIDYAASQPMTNAEFPYVDQNKITADQNASAWALSQIALPSGGEINIEYESDDYAFVQNVPAGQMFKVLGTSNTLPTFATGNGSNLLYQSPGSNNAYLIVDLLNATDVTTSADFIKYYLKDINENNKQLFFKFLVNLTNGSAPTPNYYEYVSGYADVEMANGKGLGGLILDASNNPTGRAWIKLKEVSLKNKGNGPVINPIAMSAIQFARINYGSVVWDTPFSPPEDIEEALKQLANAATASLKTMITGFKNPNKALADKNYCKEFIAAKSMVRLYNPTSKMLGGGSRVKRLYVDDKWTSMTASSPNPGQMNSRYGQSYDYTNIDEYGRTISSGVASYEPMIGSEENSMKQPFYLGKNKWALGAPDDRYYVEGPFGESFFPSPDIGYSKIKVSSIIPANATKSNKNGYKVYEFYTAKDYPTICKHTPIMPKQFRSPLKSLIKIASRDLITASQGYVINTNDMHGKPKAECDYAEGKVSPEKETRFYYKTKNGGYKEPAQIGLYYDASYSGNQLDNNCSVIKKDANVVSRLIGVDFDAIADFRESETRTNMINVQINAATFLVGLVPVIVPSVWGAPQFELSRFRSSVITKVINQYGVLDKIMMREDLSSVTSENVAFDEETGDVLVTKTTNNFEDPVYNVKYPAHWGYDLMGGAYKNTGISFSGASTGSGNYNIYNTAYLLNVGDELALTSGSVAKRVWVCSITSQNTIGLIDQDGNAVTNTPAKLKVIRSAKRNLYGKQMAVLTCLNNPIVNGKLSVVDATSKVLDAKAMTYSDNWQMHKGYTSVTQGNNCNYNVSPLGMELITNLETLFNNYTNMVASNQYQIPHSNAFFTGTFTPSPALTSPHNSYPGRIYTSLYRDNLTLGTIGTGYNTISSGFNNGNSFPNLNNYNFSSNLIEYIPYTNNTNYNPYLGYAPYVSWIGPHIFNPFNGTNKLSGLYISDGQPCNVSFEFTNLTANDPTINQIKNHIYLLPSSGWPNPLPWNYVDIIPLSNQTDCDSGSIKVNFAFYDYAGTLLYQNNQVVLNAYCFSGSLLNSNTNSQCGKLENNKVNPYFVGIKGNWRSKANYTYLTNRVQNISSVANGSNTSARGDGYYSSFAHYFSANAGAQWTSPPPAGATADKWVSTAQTTKYSPFGDEIESRDALGRYTSALYGYNEAYPIAIANNAQLQEIAYDGFEDYDYYPACNREHHFDFYSYAGNLSANESHTGKYSMKLGAGSTFSQNKKVINTYCQPLPGTSIPPSPLYPCSYYLKCYDFINPFTPVSVNAQNAATDYVISYWVKESSSGAQPLDYTNNLVTVTQGSGAAFATKNLKRSMIIDGWQRVEYIYTIPYNYSGPISVNLINSTANADVYFDDIRMHPASSSLKSFVYHPTNLKYVAALDENNFATFYEYDDQGNLIRIKKETERGIMTILESKTHYAN